MLPTIIFIFTNRTERPARSTLALILNWSYQILFSPIDSSGQGYIFRSHIQTAILGACFKMVLITVHDSCKFMVQKIAVVVEFQCIRFVSHHCLLVVLRNHVLIFHENFETKLFFVRAIFFFVKLLECVPFFKQNVPIADCLDQS